MPRDMHFHIVMYEVQKLIYIVSFNYHFAEEKVEEQEGAGASRNAPTAFPPGRSD